mgnify:FL=1|tara:strand:+ start:437 stop:571 length:135 start_codon:yes stop_codon:yes gene_type:complete
MQAEQARAEQRKQELEEKARIKKQNEKERKINTQIKKMKKNQNL